MTADAARVKLPPHSIEAEQSLLGGLMQSERTAWHRVADLVNVDDQYRADHRLILRIIERRCRDGLDVDAVTVGEDLSRLGQLEAAGGLAYLARLVEDTPSAANIEAYARIVRERSVQRQLLAISHRIGQSVDDGRDRSAAELVADAERMLLALREGTRVGRGLRPSVELARDLIDDLARRGDGARGLSLGLADFDELTNGLDPGDLVVLAGRPGMGKTSLLVTIAAEVSKALGVAVFSAEMPALQLMRRCVALLGRVSQGELRKAERMTDADWAAVSDATSTITKRALWIDDSAAPSLDHIRAEVLMLKARAPLGLVLVDYVQLVQGRGGNRYEQLRDVAYGMKALAKETAVPVVVLAQLNRGVEGRYHKRPRLADLRDSGAIEEAADIVGLLFSEGYYDRDCSMPYVTECIVEKNRNGERGLCLWRFAGEHSRVSVLEPGPRAEYRHLLAKATKRGRDDDL